LVCSRIDLCIPFGSHGLSTSSIRRTLFRYVIFSNYPLLLWICQRNVSPSYRRSWYRLRFYPDLFICTGSFVYAKRYIIPLKIPSAALTAYQLGIGLSLLAFVTNYHGIGNIWTDAYASIGLIARLNLLGTGGAYIIYSFIIESLGAVYAD